MATGIRDQFKSNPDELDSISKEVSRREKRLNEERRKLELERRQSEEERRQLSREKEELSAQSSRVCGAPTQLIQNTTSTPLISQPTTENISPPTHSFSHYIVYLHLDTIPKFNGQNIAVPTFTNTCERVPMALRGYPINNLINGFKQRLTGDSEALLTQMEFQSVNDFTQWIKRLYSPRKTFTDYWNEVCTLRQGRSESVATYATRVRRLETEIINFITSDQVRTSDYIIENTKSDILKYFIEGLNRSIQLKLTTRNFLNLNEALLAVTAAELKIRGIYGKQQASHTQARNFGPGNQRYDSRYDNRRVKQEFDREDKHYDTRQRQFNERPNYYQKQQYDGRQNYNQPNFPKPPRLSYNQEHPNRSSQQKRYPPPINYQSPPRNY
ncbi:hypothetical protein M0804_015270 [Polistes exclamans]|nr:hypothetical protein M0804_015270 [Polistes exclamans]